MFDTVCKFLIETFPTDFATWLLGEPIALTTLSPSELSLEPIRADALILLQSETLILHVEFQTRPKPDIPFRMLDYRVRVHRRFPNKKMRQVVIYLEKTQSDMAWQTTFELENTQHRFEVVRLWEQPLDKFLSAPGLLPFAALSQTDDKEAALRQVAERIQVIPTQSEQSNLVATAAILSALVLNKSAIRRILRSDLMQESAIYQDIIEEGMAKGIAQGKAEGKAEALQEVTQRRKLVVLRQLRRFVGDVSEADQQQINQLSYEQVEALSEALIDFSGVEDLSNWLSANGSAS